ncbi:MAG: hypothetical protein Q8K02_09820, partial [Flavobacterium sp.]|nr:hypothetical protein [Flavobacterium sp.]
PEKKEKIRAKNVKIHQKTTSKNPEENHHPKTQKKPSEKQPKCKRIGRKEKESEKTAGNPDSKGIKAILCGC